MNTEQRITEKLEAGLQPALLQVANESPMHSGPATDSHFKVTLVSEIFDGQSRVARHRRVYQLLKEELDSGLHALALHLYSPAEWQERQEQQGGAPASPDCRGGG